MNAHAPKGIEKSEQEENCTKRSPLGSDAAVFEHQVTVVIREEENEQQNQAEQVHLPVHHSCLFGENGNDFEENELEKIAGEGENDAEDDLNEDTFLFVLFVETTDRKSVV